MISIPIKNRACDVLIVGGGIAGIAVAERLAREAYRQGKKISIVLIERDPQLAMRASSGLEGWFHTGSLYAKIETGHSFITCLKSLEDMTNWYAQDSLFLHHDACTIDYRTGSGIRVVPGSKEKDPRDKWFESPIQFVVKPDPYSYQWLQTTQLIHERLDQVYFKQGWVNKFTSTCQMPRVNMAMPELSSIENDKIPSVESQRIQSADVTMNTGLILKHLAESASKYGVEFLVNHSALLESQSRESENHIVAFDSITNEHVGFQAGQIIYALGDRSFSGVNEGLRFHRFESVMIVRRPAILEENTVVLCADRTGDINHVFHPNATDGYSILADSNSTMLLDGQAKSSFEVQSVAAKAIFNKAKEQFGDDVGDYSSWNMISCIKTEVQSDSDSHRVYSYWWGPEYASWSHPIWTTRREENQFEAQESIRRMVLQMDDEFYEQINTDSWVTKKAIHYGLLETMASEDAASIEKFQLVQLAAHETAKRHASSSCTSPIHVIPGKFSLFPSVAHNVYLESEMRGIFINLKSGRATARELPIDIIAQPLAIRVVDGIELIQHQEVETEK